MTSFSKISFSNKFSKINKFFKIKIQVHKAGDATFEFRANSRPLLMEGAKFKIGVSSSLIDMNFSLRKQTRRMDLTKISKF